jgi:hypothetical protein
VADLTNYPCRRLLIPGRESLVKKETKEGQQEKKVEG